MAQALTNGLENYWRLLKRSIKGMCFSVEPFHPVPVSGRIVPRFNNRTDVDAERFSAVVSGIVGKP